MPLRVRQEGPVRSLDTALLLFDAALASSGLWTSTVGSEQAGRGEAFDMVRDFPESAPALLDLRLAACAALEVFMGGDVIEVYIKTIKALRLVDPRGLLLEGVLRSQEGRLERLGLEDFFIASDCMIQPLKYKQFVSGRSL
eukprot:Skav202523  [mRNA]  locus=scaffold2011:30897:32575:- [translate_table: standard]